jgi:hypothetical protein
MITDYNITLLLLAAVVLFNRNTNVLSKGTRPVKQILIKKSNGKTIIGRSRNARVGYKKRLKWRGAENFTFINLV